MSILITYEQIIQKINLSKEISILNEKEIQGGKSISLSNGGKLNSYNSGKCVIQGKCVEEIKEILEEKISQNRKVFVVYGHDEIARTQLDALLRRWDLEPIILDQQASSGQTIIEKLETYRKDIGFAIVLATPDDEGKAKTETEYKSRVRQNVVLELGMCLAELGREKVVILLKEQENFEKPSDIQGLVYIPFKNNVEETSLSLIRELVRQDYNIDKMKL